MNSTFVKKVLVHFVLCFTFLGCSPTDDCCVNPTEPIDPPVRIVKDWDPRESLYVEGSIFTVSYNERLQQPNWIQYDVRAIEKVADRDGMQFYEVDSIITSDNYDYYDNPWDRGHLAPAGSFTDSHENLYATFSFLNCTLQKDQLNRGEWADLESKIRIWAHELGTLNIEITLHFDEGATVLSTGATIPSAYTKSVTFPDGTRRCFYFPNEDTTAAWEEYEVDCSS